MSPEPSLNPGAASPLYLQLQRSLRGMIQLGEWQPGLRIPPVQELAERFNVHRLTVLKALAGLRSTGWIQTVTGRGTFVADRLPQAPVLGNPGGFPF
ncbi:MAG: GntR family transcriptional regulator, partial [Holophaga sp.]|nr:GntR family transcriptional regulator [Holophaga sp.]